MNLINLIDLCKVYDLPDPLSGISLPAPLDADACRSAILIRCGMLEPVYYEPEVFTQIFASWFAMRSWNFKHLLAVIEAEYSPIENTDRYSEHKIARNDSGSVHHSGNDITRLSGNDITAATGTDSTAATGTDTETRTPNTTETRTDEISAENAATYQADSKHTTTENGTETTAMQHGKTDTTTYGKTDTTTYGKTETIEHGLTEKRTGEGGETYTEHTHGNIGVTSNVTLINEELDLIRRFNVYEWIAERIEEDFFVQVY